MGELVNLYRMRKRNARKVAENDAQTNRAKFGRTREERERDTQQTSRSKAALDRHRLIKDDE